MARSEITHNSAPPGGRLTTNNNRLGPMSRLVLGIASVVAPAIVLSVPIGWVIVAMTGFPIGDDEIPPAYRVPVVIGLLAVFAAVVATFVLMIVYMIHVKTCPAIPPERKTSWMIALYLGNVFVFPVYWLLFIRERSQASRTSE